MSTVHWRPNEASLSRMSLNAMLKRSKLDVTEGMMREASMGRQAEMGPNWTPGGLVTRRIAQSLTQAKAQEQLLEAQPPRPSSVPPGASPARGLPPGVQSPPAAPERPKTTADPTARNAGRIAPSAPEPAQPLLRP